MKNYTMLISGLLLAFKMATAEELKLPSVQPLAALVELDGKFYQPVTISLDYQGGPRGMPILDYRMPIVALFDSSSPISPTSNLQ